MSASAVIVSGGSDGCSGRGFGAGAQTRERLAEFVGAVVLALPRVRQRENALVYVRGLIEQGGRKSLQPTLFSA